MICAMPNTVPPLIDESSFNLTLKEARSKAVCDYGLIVGASNGNTSSSRLVLGAVAKKLYLNQTHNPSNALALANTEFGSSIFGIGTVIGRYAFMLKVTHWQLCCMSNR